MERESAIKAVCNYSKLVNGKFVGDRPRSKAMYVEKSIGIKPNKKWNKVFCIGLNKTGTTSLHYAFKELGLTTFHGGTYDDDIDCFSDGRYYKIFKELDIIAPNSKFILNTRDLKSWVLSRIKHIMDGGNTIPDFGQSYNIENIKEWIEQRDILYTDIISYFKERPSDLLVFDVCAGDGYKKLCNFLEIPVINKPFPKSNMRRKHNIPVTILNYVNTL